MQLKRSLFTDALIYAGIALSLAMSTSDMTSSLSSAYLVGFFITAVLFVCGRQRAAGAVGIISTLLAWATLADFGNMDRVWAVCQIVAFAAMLGWPVPQPSAAGRIFGLAAIAASIAASAMFGPQASWFVIAAIGIAAAPLRPAVTLGAGAALSSNLLYILFSPLYLHQALSTPTGVLQVVAAPAAVLLVLASRLLPRRASKHSSSHAPGDA